MLDPTRRFKLSYHTGFCNKENRGDRRNYAQGWQNGEFTCDEIKLVIVNGYAICVQVAGYRNAKSFLASQIVTVDIDDGMSPTEALQNPFVRQHAAFLYTTAGHTPEKPRFRIVFLLERTIVDAAEQRAAMRAAALRLGGDPAATDAVRISFGNTAAEMFDIGQVLTEAMLDELIAQGARPPQPDRDKAGLVPSPSRAALTFGPDQTVRLADGRTVLVSEAPSRATAFCLYHNDHNASAFIVINRKGVRGIHCSTCGQTYWPKGGAEEFDFTSFVNVAKDAVERYRNRETRPLPEWGLSVDKVSSDPTPIASCHVQLAQSLDDLRELTANFTLVRSPKGTGKTATVERLIRDCGDVLLIGHRRALIRQTCKRLNLRCYLDKGSRDWKYWGEGRFSICVDSIGKLPPIRRYGIVVLDEAEQLLSHFLSDTLKYPWSEFAKFRSVLRSARYVIALDADLGWLTFATLLGCLGGGSKKGGDAALSIFINEPPPPEGRSIELYEADTDLTGALREAVAAGKRCYVACNARWRAEELGAAFRAEFPAARVLVVTANTVGDPEVINFIADASTRALDYDVIIASPSLGTGIDITFPDFASLIDVVFGYCDPRINAHFDFDQQIGRVRHPGEIKVWITARRFHFETNEDAVKQHLLENCLYKNVLLDYTDEGRPIYAVDDPFIDMATLITVQQRASKNNLKANFIRHKESQGFTMIHVPRSDAVGSAGRTLMKAGKKLQEETRTASLLGTQTLRRSDFRRLNKLIEAEQFVTQEQRQALERTRIELFYRQPFTEELATRDNQSRLRQKVRALEQVLLVDDDYHSFVEHVGDPEHDPGRLVEALPDEMRFVKRGHSERLVLRNLLLRAALFNQDGFQPSVEVRSSDLDEFVSFVQANRAQIENALSMEVRRDIQSKPMTQLNLVLKLVGLTAMKAGSMKEGSHKVYLYKLDPERLALMTSIVAARQAAKAWDAVYRIYGWDPANDPKDQDYGLPREDCND
jgi:hypothetical protein